MQGFERLEKLIENFNSRSFNKLSALEKAIVLYLKDNEINEEYFNEAKRDASYIENALPYLAHPRLMSLLAQSLEDKYAFFKLDPTLDFSLEMSEQEILEFICQKFGVDQIKGKYSAKTQEVFVVPEINKVIEQFFKTQISAEILPEIEDLLLDSEGDAMLDIQIRAHHGGLKAHEVEDAPVNMHFWKSAKNSTESISKTIGMGSIILALSLSACSKGVEQSNSPNPKSAPGVSVPKQATALVFANYPISRGGPESPTFWPFTKESRISFPSEINDFSFSSEIDSLTVHDLFVYSSKNSSPLCVYRWTGSNFVLVDSCEVTLQASEALLVRGIPADYSVTLQSEIQVLE